MRATAVADGRRLKAPLAVLVSVLLVPLVSPALSASAAEDRPTLVTLELSYPGVDTAQVGGTLNGGRRQLEVLVQLPAGYTRHPERTYPILYLLHGASVDPRTWVDTPELNRTVSGIDAIVVMPDAGEIGMYTNWQKPSGPRWQDFHLDVVVPMVESQFRVRPGRRWHTVGGISMGGQGALRYAEADNDYFGSVMALSPALPDMQSLTIYAAFPVAMTAAVKTLVRYEDVWGPRSGAFATLSNPIKQVAKLANTRIFIASGSGVPCLTDPPQAPATFDFAEPFIALDIPRFVAKAQAEGADVTQHRGCGLHTHPVFGRALAAAVHDWGLFGDGA